MTPNLLCLACGKEWKYKGNSTRATCPGCKKKINTNNKSQKRFIRIDFEPHVKSLIELMNQGRTWAVLDCIGDSVSGISTIDLDSE